MGNSRTNEKDKPPVSTDFSMSNAPDIHATHSLIFQEGNGSGGHFASIPNMPLPFAPAWDNMYTMNQSMAQGIPETSGNPMADFMIPNSFQNPQINLSSDIANINLQEGSHCVNQDRNSFSFGATSDGAGISSIQNIAISRNFAGDSTFGPFNRPHVNADIVGSPLLFSPDSGPMRSRNSVNFNTSQCGVQEKVDGSFLSLGIGGTEEAISRSQLRTREVSDKLKEAASAELKMARARKAMGQTLDASFTGFQRNASGFSNQLYHVDQRTSTNNDVAVLCSPNSGPGSSQYHVLQSQQNDMQLGICRHDDSNSNFPSNKNVRYDDLGHYRAFVGNQASHSGTPGGNSARFFNSHQSELNVSAPGSVPSWVTSNTPSGQLQNMHFKAANSLPSECNMNSPLGLGSCSTRQNYAGQQPVSHNSMGTQGIGEGVLSQRIAASQVARIGGAQAAAEAQFPKRLGVEFNGRDSPQAAFMKGTNMQTTSTGQIRQIPDKGSTRVPDHLHLPPFIDQTDRVPINYASNSQGPSFPHGQSQAALTQIPKDPRVSASIHGSTIQRSGHYSRPYLKRGALAPPPASHWVQRQKTTHPSEPIPFHTRPSVPVPSQIKRTGPVPAPVRTHFRPQVPVTSVPVAAHITRKDPNRTPQLSGHKCFLCKRDLSLTSKGVVYQPATPLTVAVLPCGHTFHDQCLHNITPKDQAKDPPCIPCAIGEH